MPNKRRKDKKYVGVWVPESLRKDLERAAKLKGQNLSDYITSAIKNALDRFEREGGDFLREIREQGDEK